MISSQNAMNPVEFHDWANEKKEYAQTLCRRALDFAQTLFQNGDLGPYLDLLSRFHAYNFYNLLLILQQYPEACCLATFQEWKKQGEPYRQVLKNEHKGKGIELIAPFTEPPRNRTRSLFWYGIKQFDLSQTLVSYEVPRSIYEAENQNAAYIELALRRILSQEYHCVFPNAAIGQNDEFFNFPGIRTGNDIYCNASASMKDRIVWLLEILLEFSDLEQIIGPQYKQQFSSWVTYCLLRTWDLSGGYYLQQDAEQIRSIPKNQQPLILDQLQVLVRHYAELVHCIYLDLCREYKGSSANV